MIKLWKLILFSRVESIYVHALVFSMRFLYMKTNTCVESGILTGLAGAVLVAGSHDHCILLVTVEL